MKTKEFNPENGWFVDDLPVFQNGHVDVAFLYFWGVSNIIVCDD